MKKPVSIFVFLLSPVLLIFNASSVFGRKKIATLLAIAIYLFAAPGVAVAQTTSFTTPGTYTYTVAPGVISLQINGSGAKGGDAICCGGSVFLVGGNGGNVVCTLAVYGGEVLNIAVGGAGKNSDLGGAGGFNGGGNAAGGGSANGGGGGGATDIRIGGTDISNRVVVGAGGGGASSPIFDALAGGDGGGLTGGSVSGGGGIRDGLGGSQSGGGAPSGTGAYGAFGVGGNSASYGGGGGGGFYGGGGGGYGTGGGGGSSYYDGSGVSGGSTTSGTNAGDGNITITTLCTVAVGTISGTFSVCLGSSTGLTESLGGGTWSSTASGIASISSSGMVSGISVGTAVISYAVTGGCGIASATSIVTVNALPDAGTITGPGAVCAGATMALTDAAAGGSWSADVSGNAGVDASGHVTGILAGTAMISYTTTTPGCGSATVSKTVTVNAIPDAGSISGQGTVCAGAMISLTDGASGGSWSAGSGHASVDASGNVTGVTAGTTTISYTVVAPGCSTTASATVTVNALPNAGIISGTLHVCAGAVTNLADAAAGGSWSVDVSGNASVDASGNVTGITAGTTIISYTAITPTCGTAVASAMVTVNAVPVAITGTPNVCTGLTVALTDATTGGLWSNDAGGIATVSSGIVTGVSAGTATITYANGPGCYQTIVVTVNQSPSAITGAGVLCAATTLSLSATSTSTGTPTVFNVTGAPQVYTVPASVYQITMTLKGGQGGAGTATAGGNGGTTMATIAVTPGQVLNVFVGDGGTNHDGSGGSCYNGGGVLGSVYGTGAGGGASDIRIGGTALSNRVIVAGGGGGGGFEESLNGGAGGGLVGMSGGFYPGTTAATGGTQASGGAGEIPPPSFTYGISGNSGSLGQGGNMLAGAGGGAGGGGYYGGGSGDNYDEGGGAGGSSYADPSVTSGVVMTQGTNTSYAGMVTITPLFNSPGLWTSGSVNATVDGSAGVVTGVTGGTANISFTIANGCSSTTIVTVNPLADAGTITGITIACVGTTTYLTDAASGGVWSATGNAYVDGSGDVTGITTGTATISYTVVNSCGTVNATAAITVNATPVAGTITGTATVCAGAVTQLTDVAGGGAWSATANASVDGSGNVMGVTAGTATVSYAVTNGCGTVYATNVVTVNAAPSVTTSASTAICAGSSAPLTAGGGTTYSWSPAAGLSATTGSSLSAYPTANTTYTVTGTTSGCSNTATVSVTVNAIPTVNVSPGISVCAGSSALLTATGGTTYSWSPAMGLDVTTGNSVNAGPSSNTTYTVTGTASGCSAIAAVTVTINTTNAGTITGPSAVTVGGSSVALSDAVAGGTWSVSNGNATIDGSGNVTGVTPGTVTVIYSVTGTCGLAGVTKLITVNGSSVSGINGSATLCLGTTTVLTDATTGGNWNTSNTSVATVGNTSGVVTGVNPGTATITYTLGGVTTTTIMTVITTPADVTGTATVCLSVNVTISDATVGGIWSSSNGDAAITPSGTGTQGIYGSVAGVTTITYSLANGCYKTHNVTVNPLPSAILAGAGEVCVGSTLMISDATGGAIGYGSSMPSIATVINSGKVTGVTAGTTTITYEISTGCMTTTIITVNAAPGAIGGNVPVCAGTGITLTDNVTGGAWSSSNTAVGTIDPSSGALTGIAGGSTIISYATGGCAVGTTVTVKPILPITGLSEVSVGSAITLADATGGGVWSSSLPGIGSVGTSGAVTGISTGTTNIIYTYSGCSRTQSVTVGAALGTIGGTQSLCQGSATTLTPPVGASGGTWSSSSPVEVTMGSTSGIATAGPYTGTVTITYTQAPGSYSTAVLTINAQPAAISGPVAAKACVNTSLTLSDATAGGAWSSSSMLIGSVSSSGTVCTVTGTGIGVLTISYVMPTTCFAKYTVSINPAPAAINTGTGVLCQGATATVSDVTGGSAGYVSSNTMLATVAGTGVVTGVGAGVVTITYYISTGCYATAPMTVNPTPVVAAISGPGTISHGSPATLSDATPGGTWSTNNIHAYSLSGTSTQTVTATALTTSGGANIYYSMSNGFGCTTTATKNVTATARYAQGSNTTVYTGATVAIADEVMTGTWSSSDNTIAIVDGSGVVTGIRPGMVSIMHDITDSEGSIVTITTAVVVNPIPASINVIPNPNKGTFTIKGTLGTVSDEEVTLEVTDVLGHVIYKSKVPSHSGSVNETVVLNSSFANGMYMLSITGNAEKIIFHFVMER